MASNFPALLKKAREDKAPNQKASCPPCRPAAAAIRVLWAAGVPASINSWRSGCLVGRGVFALGADILMVPDKPQRFGLP